ncbi:MAG: hypothetical protein CML17_07315 [Pusillimonas sp.]|nr:hypothetical protein [Pusillimonas sp.]
MGKGRSSAPAEQTITQTNLPPYIEPYVKRILNRGEGISNQPYEAYEGQRIAEDAADVTASRDRARQIAGSGIEGLAEAMSRAEAGAGFDAGKFDAATAGEYMSPFMQKVVDVQKERAILDAQRAGADRAAQAVQAGAFGGSRAAIQEGLADEALSRQLAEIQASGQQQAFEQAQQQFERDRSARADAERIGLGAAELLAGLGGQGRASDIESAKLLETIGKDIEAKDQAGIDMAYEDFIRQRDFDKEQLMFLSALARGIPVTPSTELQKFQNVNPLQQLLGTGIAGLGLYKGIQGL